MQCMQWQKVCADLQVLPDYEGLHGAHLQALQRVRHAKHVLARVLADLVEEPARTLGFYVKVWVAQHIPTLSKTSWVQTGCCTHHHTAFRCETIKPLERGSMAFQEQRARGTCRVVKGEPSKVRTCRSTW